MRIVHNTQDVAEGVHNRGCCEAGVTARRHRLVFGSPYIQQLLDRGLKIIKARSWTLDRIDDPKINRPADLEGLQGLP